LRDTPSGASNVTTSSHSPLHSTLYRMCVYRGCGLFRGPAVWRYSSSIAMLHVHLQLAGISTGWLSADSSAALSIHRMPHMLCKCTPERRSQRQDVCRGSRALHTRVQGRRRSPSQPRLDCGHDDRAPPRRESHNATAAAKTNDGDELQSAWAPSPIRQNRPKSRSGRRRPSFRG
jgi:hypothetical protein